MTSPPHLDPTYLPACAPRDDGYSFDVFLSYRRSGRGSVAEWVRNHFHPLLVSCLADELPEEPRVFIDLEAETGCNWPSLLEETLLRSRLLVAVWSPPYFRSSWCLAEWTSMEARDRAVRSELPGRIPGLVYPVVYADSAHFPPAARDRQARDMKAWSFPAAQYRESHDYHGLHREMRKLASEIAGILPRTPAWTPGWPVWRPQPPTVPPVDLPKV